MPRCTSTSATTATIARQVSNMHFFIVLKAQRRIICAKRFILYSFSELKAVLHLVTFMYVWMRVYVAYCSEYLKHFCVKFIVFETACAQNTHVWRYLIVWYVHA